MRPHRRQPIRLHHPWDSPGKNTGVGCHFLLQCMKVKSCPTLSDPMDCNLPGSSVHGIFQSKVLEWGVYTHTHTQFIMRDRLMHLWRLTSQNQLSASWGPRIASGPNSSLKTGISYCPCSMAARQEEFPFPGRRADFRSIQAFN